MQLKDLSATLLRRWYLTLTGLLAVGAICVAVFEFVPASYETEANIVLLPPESSVGEGGNPYLYLGGLEQATDVLTRALTSDASRTQVLDSLGHADYDVLPDWATSGPILIITGRGATGEQAVEVRDAVMASVPSTLVVLQRALNVPNGSQITSMVLTSDDKPTVVMKSRLRAVAAAGLVSLVGVIMLIGLMDGLLTTRTTRRARRRLEAAAAAQTPMLEPMDEQSAAYTHEPRTGTPLAADAGTSRRALRSEGESTARTAARATAGSREDLPRDADLADVVAPRPSSMDELDALLQHAQGSFLPPGDRH